MKDDLSNAIGWVHNRNASVANSFYAASGDGNENFLGCTAPDPAIITLTGFFHDHPHYITWFPTRTGAVYVPPDPEEEIRSTIDGELVIDLTGQFGGVVDNYLDTLRSDYAFVITPQPFAKSLPLPNPEEEVPVDTDWDFSLYPNPTRESVQLRFSDDIMKQVTLLDVSGRRVVQHSNIVASVLQLPTSQFAKVVYWVHVASGENSKVKKLIIH